MKKDKFVKLIKFYLIDFTNEVERFGKPTEVSQARFFRQLYKMHYLLIFG